MPHLATNSCDPSDLTQGEWRPFNQAELPLVKGRSASGGVGEIGRIFGDFDHFPLVRGISWGWSRTRVPSFALSLVRSWLAWSGYVSGRSHGAFRVRWKPENWAIVGARSHLGCIKR